MLRLIYLRDNRILVSRKAYQNWKEIQAEYDSYMASLGPWSLEEILDFLNSEYPATAERMRGAVLAFADSPALTCEI
jgi:hypothetical protein